MLYRIVIFLILNFLGLAFGAKYTGPGVASEWYQNLDQAPWTPAGWVFAVAWTSIMLCFTFYLAFLWGKLDNKSILIALFALEWTLNLAWNPVFFHFHLTGIALILISLLTLLIFYFLINFWSELGYKSVLILPYVIWLLIATPLNAYIYFNN